MCTGWGLGLRLSTVRGRDRSEVMADSKREPRAAAGSGLESGCHRHVWAARTRLQELPGVGTGRGPCPKHMV